MEPQVREVVLVNCCDVVRRIYDILRRNRRMDFLYLLDLPHRNGERERQLFAEQLKKLTESYETYAGRAFDWRRAWEALAGGSARGGRTLRQPYGRPRRTGSSGDRPGIPGRGKGAGRHCSGRRRLLRPEKSPGNREAFFEEYAGLLLEQYPCMRMQDTGDRRKAGSGGPGALSTIP